MVGISVWPPARSFASSCLASRLAAWRTVAGRCWVNAYIVSGSYAALALVFAFCNACHTACAVAGMAKSSVPIASVMALMTATGAAIAPASPQPLMPSGFEGDFVMVMSTFSAGRSWARGMQ